jgi:hypothetical protein
MATLTSEPRPVGCGTTGRRGRGVDYAAVALAVVLVGLVGVHLPAFLCMPLDADVSLWDQFARMVSSGSVAYRDVLENNFPGMLWAHLVIRTLFGWRSEVLRAVDITVVATIVTLLVKWLPTGASLAWRIFTVLVLASFYLTTSEWCHCQRDTWMLLPALLALVVRRAQIAAILGEHAPVGAVAGRGLLEGILWAAAFWIKPFVAVPCVVCWISGVSFISRSGTGRVRRILLDGVSVLAGGAVAGVAGCAWLIVTGAWTDFLDVMMVWNREYVRFNMGRDIGWLYQIGPLVRLAPWPLVHLVAVPVALAAIWRGESIYRVLLGALYIGWFGQAVLLQHIYDYIHVPPLLLGIAVLCQRVAIAAPGLARTCLIALLLLGVGTRLPALTEQRFTGWSACIQEGSTPELRDRFSILSRMSWSDLEGVRAFLQSREVGDGELTCLSMRTVPLYQELGVRPSTRYLFLENVLIVFAGKRAQVTADLATSQQRFVVCDILTTRWRLPDELRSSGDSYRVQTDLETAWFPKNALAARCGRYVVYDVRASDMPAWIRDNLDP